jgi:hypothetical protein
MALYRIGRRGTVVTSGQVVIDVACSTGARPKIMEWGAFLGAATASRYSLRRMTNIGTRTTPVALEAEDPGDPVLAGINLVDCAIAWSGEPTESAVALAVIGLPATIGVGIIWTFPRGLTIANSLSLAIVNDATNSAALDSHMVADI